MEEKKITVMNVLTTGIKNDYVEITANKKKLRSI